MKAEKNESKIKNRLKKSSIRVVEFEELKSKHRLAKQLLLLQRDLGIALSSTSNQNEVLNLILDAICQVEGIDCGGVYLVDATTGDLNLAHHTGLPLRFVEAAAYYTADSPQARMVRKREPIYGNYQEISHSKHEVHRSEGLRAIAVIPINHEGQVVAALNVASHTHDEIPFDARHALESIAAQIAGVFGRLKAEAAVQESQKDLTALFSGIDDFLFVLDYDGNILHVNQSVVNQLGYSVKEISSMNVVTLHPPDRREEARGIIAAMMAGEISECPIPLVTKSGALIPVETKVTKGRWSGQNVLFGICRDITERKQAEEKLQKAHDELEQRVEIRTAELAKAVEDLQQQIAVRIQAEQALRKSEERFLEIAENIREVFWLFDWIEQKVVYVSPAYAIIWGRSVNDLYNRYDDWAESIYPDDLKYAQESFSEIVQTGKSTTREYRIVRPNGDVRWIADNTFAIENEKGQVCRMAGVAEDITERKRVENALKESEAKYKQMVENVPVAIYEMDIQAFRFTKVNDVMCEVLGYSEDELLAINPMDIFAEESKQLVSGRMKKIQAGENVAPSIEYRIKTKHGRELWVLINSKTIYENGKPVRAIVVAQDISERKTLEERLLRAQKMEAIGTLAGGIAHDFNNILMSIQGYASLMLYELASTHHHYEPLQNIEKQVRNAAQLTAQLLGYARKGKYHVLAIDLNQFVAETSETFGRARKEISIHHECVKDLHPIEADQGQIEQVLLNLYINAADAMPNGGKLIIKTSNVSHEDMKDKMYNPKPGSYVLLEIKDTGTGMDKEIQERIFDPFFTTKEMGKGTGLGLASVYGIVKGHGGYIDVYSEKGRGTAFQIYLPASDKEADTKSIERLNNLDSGTETILLVEDEELVLDVGIKMLRKMGYAVIAAKNGEEAIALYKEKQDTIDMVILDMVLPGMGGSEVYDAMKKINPDILVLLASGYSLDSQAKQILSRGCNGFIQKPFNLREMSAKIKEILLVK